MATWEIRCGDCRELLAGLEAESATLVFADPPFGVGKAEWDHDEFSSDWLEEAARVAAGHLVVTPGISNLLSMPATIPGGMDYHWTLSAWLSNQCCGGGIWFGNWIPAVVYWRPGTTSTTRRGQDAKRIVIKGEMPAHPSPKPIEFMQWIVGLFTEPGDLVIDPFCGSGSTGVACVNLGRRFLGFEIDEGYCAMARRRVSQAQEPLVVT